jgi:hypothetical protein
MTALLSLLDEPDREVNERQVLPGEDVREGFRTAAADTAYGQAYPFRHRGESAACGIQVGVKLRRDLLARIGEQVPVDGLRRARVGPATRSRRPPPYESFIPAIGSTVAPLLPSSIASRMMTRSGSRLFRTDDDGTMPARVQSRMSAFTRARSTSVSRRRPISGST